MSVLPQLLSETKPVLLPHVSVVHRLIRTEAWVVLTNELTGQHMRLNQSAWHQVSRFRADRSLSVPGDPLDENLVQLVMSLHRRGMIALGCPRESELLIALQTQLKSEKWKQRWLNPLYLRFSLFDPDKLIERLLPRVEPLFHRQTLVVILMIILVAISFGIVNRAELGESLAQVAAAPVHWWLYVLIYPLMKGLHEAAHAVCVKRWGGEIHETGITLLVLFPLPYVNASDTWRFPEKTQRLLVNASGMLIEGALAAIALILWCFVETGTVRDVLLAIAILGSVSTLLFNANPLLKFDGYYFLQDALDLPNLASRASGYYLYLLRKYLFKIDAISPVTAIGERRWFLVYGALSLFYRWFIFAVIAFWLVGKFQIVGLLLISVGLYQLVVLPLVRAWNYLCHSEELQGRRASAWKISATAMCLVILLVFAVPLPSSTRIEGVLWVPKQAQVFAPESGFVHGEIASAGRQVNVGETLITLTTPQLSKERMVAGAARKRVEIDYREAQLSDPGRATALRHELGAAQAKLKRMQTRLEGATIAAKSAGRFTPRMEGVHTGDRVVRGDLLGYVVSPSSLRVRAVVPQSQFSKVQEGVEEVYIRLASRFQERLPGRLIQQTPSANNYLPSASLAYDGSSGIVVASEADTLTTRERVFHLELALPEGVEAAGIGGTAYVTLTHEWETAGARLGRTFRQLFLNKLGV